MDSVSTSIARIKAALEKDEFRISIQTAGAVLLAYGVMIFFDLPELAWGAFSALFVVQASIGGTIGTALTRVLGALIGAVIALALVALWDMEGWHVFVSLFFGVVSMSLITARWPALSYGLVTVTIVIVTPDFYAVEAAIEKVVAIAIGSACGMVAAIILMPVTARRSADEHLATAVRGCGEFLVECMKCLTDGKGGGQKQISQEISLALSQAHLMTEQADIEKKTQVMPFHPSPETLPQEVERFRYTLTLVDRISDTPLSEDFSRQHKAALQALAESAQTQLKNIALSISACGQCEEMDKVWECFKEFSECVNHSVRVNPSEHEDTEQLIAMKWAYHSVLLNMGELTDHVNQRAKEAT